MQRLTRNALAENRFQRFVFTAAGGETGGAIKISVEQRVNVARRELLRFMAAGLAGAGASAGCLWRSWADDADGREPFNVRSFGAVATARLWTRRR